MASTIGLIFILLILVVLFIVCGVYITKAAHSIKEINGWENDPFLVNARDWALRGAWATWLTVALTVTLFIIGLFIGVDEVAASGLLTGSGVYFIYFFLALTMFLIVFITVVSIYTIKRLTDDPNYSSSNPAYTEPKRCATIAAVIGFLTIFLTLATIIIVAVTRSRAKKEEKTKEEDNVKTKAQTVANIINAERSNVTKAA